MPGKTGGGIKGERVQLCRRGRGKRGGSAERVRKRVHRERVRRKRVQRERERESAHTVREGELSRARERTQEQKGAPIVRRAGEREQQRERERERNKARVTERERQGSVALPSGITLPCNLSCEWRIFVCRRIPGGAVQSEPWASLQ